MASLLLVVVVVAAAQSGDSTLPAPTATHTPRPALRSDTPCEVLMRVRNKYMSVQELHSTSKLFRSLKTKVKEKLEFDLKSLIFN